MDDYGQREHLRARDVKEVPGTTQRGSFDDRTETTGMAIVSTIASRADADPVELDPLWSVVNTDALDDLFQPGTAGTVAFTYNGYDVVVHSDGRIDATEADE